jgi:hypothetical protein
VRGAADGRKLGERLDDGEDDDLVKRHGISYRNIEFEYAEFKNSRSRGSQGRWSRAR